MIYLFTLFILAMLNCQWVPQLVTQTCYRLWQLNQLADTEHIFLPWNAEVAVEVAFDFPRHFPNRLLAKKTMYPKKG